MALEIADPQKLTDLVAQATAIVKETASKTTSAGSSIGQKLQSGLVSSSGKIQGLLDSILAQNGVVSQDQFNQLDEEVRIAKMNILARDSKNALSRLVIYAGVFILGVGILTYFAKKKAA